MVIPNHYFHFLAVASGNCTDVGLLLHSGADNLVEGKSMRAGDFYAFIAKQTKHPESV